MTTRKTILPIHSKFMNAKRNSYYLLMALAVILVMFSSCGKENQQIDYNVGVLASQEYVQSQQMMDLLLNTYFKSITDSLLIVDYSSSVDGATVTYRNTPGETIIINYPLWGCEDECGHNRAGKITAVAHPGFYDSLAVINLSFDEFRYDGDTLLVNGFTITNKGKTDGLNDAYAVKAQSVQRIYADTMGGGTHFSMDQIFVREKDPATIYHSTKDRFMISGTIKGVSSTGYSYMAHVETEGYILDQFSCNWAKLGPALLSLESQVYSTFILFPGADTCANRYVVDIEGNSFYFLFD